MPLVVLIDHPEEGATFLAQVIPYSVFVFRCCVPPLCSSHRMPCLSLGLCPWLSRPGKMHVEVLIGIICNFYMYLERCDLLSVGLSVLN